MVRNGRQPGTQIVEGLQLNRALQEELRRDGAGVQLTVDKSSVLGYSPNIKNVRAERRRISTVRNYC
jgi:hypothetical protein